MICAIDVGNTNIVVALMKDVDDICFCGRIFTERDKTKEKFVIELNTMLDAHNMSIKGVEGVIISSVVPELTPAIKDGIKQITGVEPLLVGLNIETGLNICTDEPSRVGADLLVDAVAAEREYGGSVVVIDMGTATTVSVVQGNNYMGTIIIPGIGISLEALSDRAAQLPVIELTSPDNLVGKNTEDSMKSCIIYGNAAMLDGLIERIEEEIGQVTVLATGGVGELIIPYCKKDIILDSDLLLKGLWYIYNMNCY